MTTSKIKVPLFLFSSKYSQRMRKLSCKIFNEFYIPELERREINYHDRHETVDKWTQRWHSDYRLFEKGQARPYDLDPAKTQDYYPAHPQIRQLTHVLREYGLFRDEHRDFNDEMKAIAIARGKTYRERRGPISKNKK